MSILPMRTILSIAAVADIAVHQDQGAVNGKAIAERLEVAERRLEASLQALTARGVLKGRRGKGGGYTLKKAPKAITFAAIADIIATTSSKGESGLAPAAAAMRVEKMVAASSNAFRAHLAEQTIADLLPTPTYGTKKPARSVPRGMMAP